MIWRGATLPLKVATFTPKNPGFPMKALIYHGPREIPIKDLPDAVIERPNTTER